MIDITPKFMEVKYFFDQMKAHRKDPEKFVYYLNAFLCSSISLVEIMQKENQTKEFKKCLKRLTTNDLYKFFKNLRQKSVHREVIVTNKTVVIEITESINIYDSLSINNNNKNVLKNISKIDSQKESGLSIDINWYFKNFKDGKKKEVVELCEKFLRNIEKVVKEYKK